LGLLLVVSLSAGLGGCSVFDFGSGGEGVEQKVDKLIWRNRDSYVRLERQDVRKGRAVPPNAHPVNISPDRLENGLAKIEIKRSKKEGPIPLFTEWELESLSKHVSAGLAQARPDQDVTFSIVGWPKGERLGLKEPKLTTGRVFYQGGQLNLIFGEAHREANDQDWPIREHESDRRLDPYVPGMRSFTKRHEWELMAEPGSGIHRPLGVKRTDWLVFAPQALAAPPTAVSARGGAPAAAASEVDQLRQELQQLRREMQSGRSAPGGYYPPAAPAQPAQTYAPPPPPQAQPPGGAGGSVQQRLLVLEDLWRRGLISDEEYETKRQKILGGF
jgi:hypothetical protein